MAHIRKGVELAAKDPSTVLVFSGALALASSCRVDGYPHPSTQPKSTQHRQPNPTGGQTRADAGPKSEGVSYFHVAEHFNVRASIHACIQTHVPLP